MTYIAIDFPEINPKNLAIQRSHNGVRTGPKTEGVARAQGETILLVEDDQQVHRLVRELLLGMDYRVLGAGGPKQALEISEKHSGPIDLLLTDVVMPQMSGTELAQQLRMSRPKLKTLFMSGYSRDSMLAARACGYAYVVHRQAVHS